MPKKNANEMPAKSRFISLLISFGFRILFILLFLVLFVFITTIANNSGPRHEHADGVRIRQITSSALELESDN